MEGFPLFPPTVYSGAPWDQSVCPDYRSDLISMGIVQVYTSVVLTLGHPLPLLLFSPLSLPSQGDDVLTDDTRMTPDNPVAYFMFNLQEPGEEELTEFRKEQRRKNRLRIDTTDWSRVPR